MEIVGLILLSMALPLLADEVRLLCLKRRVQAEAARSRSILPSDWREHVGDWIELIKDVKDEQ